MARLNVIIDGTDYTEYVEDVNLTSNSLDADGSGRDVQTGLMHRTKIGDKWQAEIKLLPVESAVIKAIASTLQQTSFTATVGAASGEFYNSTIVYGSARWRKSENRTYYTGAAFTIISVKESVRASPVKKGAQNQPRKKRNFSG